MSEFNNRISAQRSALEIVNGSNKFSESLLSLTDKAIERWSKHNRLDSQDSIVSLLKSLSGSLFFLANKSQEQISEDYKSLSDKVNKQLSDLTVEVVQRKNHR